MLQNQQISRRLTVPNCITFVRIIGTLSLMGLEPFGTVFYVMYTLCGITDVLDGWIARATKKTTEFGAKLDSVADLLFYTVSILKIFPFLWKTLPKKIWFLLAVIIFVRICSYGTAAMKYHRFASQHTYLNKMSGFAVFLLPYMIVGAAAVVYSYMVCGIALVAAVEELLIHITAKEYRSDRRTILQMR